MHVPAWAWKAAPYVFGAGIGLWLVLRLIDYGRDDERAKWAARESAAVAAAQAKADELQAQVDAAGVALSEKQQQIEAGTRTAVTNTRTYYVTRPDLNVQCLGPDRLRHIADSDQRATAASAAQ
jgi:hypothetical protein